MDAESWARWDARSDKEREAIRDLARISIELGGYVTASFIERISKAVGTLGWIDDSKN